MATRQVRPLVDAAQGGKRRSGRRGGLKRGSSAGGTRSPAAEHARRLAHDRAQPVALGGEARQALHQADRVRVTRVGEDRVDVAHLDDTAGVHHGDAVAPGDEPEVVRDQDRGRVRLLLGGLEHLDHLRLDRHVERSRRLVGDQELRLVRDRHRDHRALRRISPENSCGYWE